MPELQTDSNPEVAAGRWRGFRRMLLPVFLLVGLATAAWLRTPQATDFFSNSRTCGSCHLLQLEIKTWEASSHNRFDCDVCHEGYGLEETVRSAAIWGYREVSALMSSGRGAEAAAVDVGIAFQAVTPVEDEVCLGCHSFNRQVTAGDLIVPHERHGSKKVWCVTCHQGVVHGVVAGKPLYSRSEQIWNLSSEELLDPRTQSPPMGFCMNCHERRRVARDCETCHEESKKPETHQTGEFLLTHGRQAQTGLEACDGCHGFEPLSVLPQRARQDAVEYARLNPFCKSCHGSKPPSHLVESWGANHGRQPDLQGCFVCHDNTPAQGGPATARTNCNRCHYRSHRKGWMTGHPYQVGRGLEGACFNCHTQHTCGQCHAGFNS